MPTGRILLAEDSPDDQALIVRALHKASIDNEVVIARDGVEAIEYLRGEGRFSHREPGRPVLALIDMNMPRLSGLDVLQHIRQNEQTSQIPSIILTTSDEEKDLRASYELRANSYVRKPIDYGEFNDTVAQLGNYWLRVNLPPTGLQ